MTITTASVYDDRGRKVTEIKRESYPKFTWTEFFVGFLGALIALYSMVIQ